MGVFRRSIECLHDDEERRHTVMMYRMTLTLNRIWLRLRRRISEHVTELSRCNKLITVARLHYAE